MTNQLYLRFYMMFVKGSSFEIPKIELLLLINLLFCTSSRVLAVVQIMWEKPKERYMNDMLNTHGVIKTVLWKITLTSVLNWKLIPMHFIKNTFEENFIFHSNLGFKTSAWHQFPTFHANILQSWKRSFSHISYTPSCIGSQFLWFNNYITIDNNSVHFNES